MKFTKRYFLNCSATLGIGVILLTAICDGILCAAYAFNQSPAIPLFATSLRGPGPGGIPIATPDTTPAPVTGVTHYTMGMSQFQDQITPTGIGLMTTTLRGYNPMPDGVPATPKHLGGIIIGKGKNPQNPHEKNVPIQITFKNTLPNKPLLPVDTTIMGADQQVNRTAVHLHGGLVPWISDGGPFDWFQPNGVHGLSFLNNATLNQGALAGDAEYYYPLNQSARFMWYHDHAYGITRLNVYAGLATGILIRDQFEAKLIANKGLPNYIEAGGRELPLIFQDKIFVGNDIATKDPAWSSMVQHVATKPGSLWYAHTYEPDQADGTGRWDVQPGGLPLPDPSIIPEFFGDTMLVNGTTFPIARVEARRYRLRMLNACNARFLNLQLYIADSSPDGITLDANGHPTNQPFINNATGDPSWLQIGTEGGFLAKPVKVASNVPFQITDQSYIDGTNLSLDPTFVQKSLLVAPAERTDLIVDFKNAAGRSVILYNDAAAPFPSGDDRNDYFPGWNVGTGLFGVGNPVNGLTQPGNGPNTRILMKFKVKIEANSGPADAPLLINETTDLAKGIDPFLLPWGSTAVPVTMHKRTLSLNEYFDDYGRLSQILGNNDTPSSIFGTPYAGSTAYLTYPGSTPENPITTVGATMENVREGDTEIWEIFNTSADVHPMHFHLVNVQVINRQVFDPLSAQPYNVIGDIIPPNANEVGWKETVPMYPGTVTRVIMKWNMASIVDKNLRPINSSAGPLRYRIKNGQPPTSPRTGGHEYVWHCHILEHEEHDMMHALVVTPNSVRPPLLP